MDSIFHEPPRLIFTTLGIIPVADPCPDISGHIKTLIGASAERKLVLPSSNCECSGTLLNIFLREFNFLKNFATEPEICSPNYEIGIPNYEIDIPVPFFCNP